MRADEKPRTVGLVLAGAVAKGAFEAGVVSVLIERDLRLRRLVGTSSGALNVAVLAAGIATGRLSLAARVMEESWRDRGTWQDTVQVSPAAVLSLGGLASVTKLRASLRDAIDRVCDSTEPGEIRPAFRGVEFQVVGTDLGSTDGTHERAFTFSGTDFETTEGRERVALACAASAAFPGLFTAVEVDGSFLADGGITNNSAISYLLEPPEVDRAIVVAASAARGRPISEAPKGATLVSSVLEIMIGDRLARDVRGARRANERLAHVRAELERHAPSAEPAIVRALGWRHVDIVEIRPSEDLEGTPFSGLFSSSLRSQYIETGKESARAALRLAAP